MRKGLTTPQSTATAASPGEKDTCHLTLTVARIVVALDAIGISTWIEPRPQARQVRAVVTCPVFPTGVLRRSHAVKKPAGSVAIIATAEPLKDCQKNS